MREDDLQGQLGDILRHGRIASVDLAAARITVALGEVETGPIRWLTGGAGGTRVWTRPKVGEQVVLLAPSGDVAGAIAIRGSVCNDFPALADAERELVQFEDGAVVAYDPAAHRLQVVLPAGATAAVVAPGGVTIEADVRIEGDVTVTGDVVAGGISLREHLHRDTQPGGGKSGKPE